MKKLVFLPCSLSVLTACSPLIPADVEVQASKTLSTACMNLFRNPSYQKRSKDILTPNPILAVSIGKDGDKEIIACGMTAANASTNYNLSGALVQCENYRETTMLDRPKAVMQPCEVYAEGNDIIFRTPRVNELMEGLRKSDNFSGK